MQKREFHFEEGNSRKFWAVSTEGASLTVQFGRIGTAGQTQQKAFADAAAADREANKLIGEKTRKGYVEIGAGVSPAGPPVATPAAIAPATPAEPTRATPPPGQKPAAPPTQVPPTAPAIQRSIKLDPLDRVVATWDPIPPGTHAPAPFDREAALNRVHAFGEIGYYWSFDWRKAAIPRWPSVEEARFWIHTFLAIRQTDATGPKLAAQFRQHFPTKALGAQQIIEVLGTHALETCALRAVSADVWMTATSRHGLENEIARVFRQQVYPQLSSEERAQLRDQFAAHLRSPQGKPHKYDWPWNAGITCAALFGLHDEMESFLARLPDGAYAGDDPYGLQRKQQTHWLVFGLASPERVRSEFERLHLRLLEPEQARAWLALTGVSGLDEIARGACLYPQGHKDPAIALAKVLLRVQAPEAAVPALRLTRESQAAAIGMEWLQKYPLEAVLGLLTEAMNGGPLAGPARDYLRQLKGWGQWPAGVESLLNPEQRAWLEAECEPNEEERLPVLSLEELPESVRLALAAVRQPKPTLIPVATLPPIRLGAGRLGPTEVSAVLHVLKEAELSARPPLCAALLEVAQRPSLDRFAWQIFAVWQSLGSPTKDKWTLGAIGQLGGDSCVLQLTPLIRAWPGESQHQRAVLGLQCLRAIGTDTALMALNGIAQKLKFKALKEKAQALMEEIAQTRGLTREQLADRIVPDCDLDARGSRVFDFGPRQFKFVLGPELKPLVRDATGKLRPDLPAPTKADEAEKAEAAVAEWKLLKKTLREVLKLQAERLEDAMISGRRWTVEEFRTLLVGHPLMINLVRQLVFAAYDEANRPVQTFRVTEDQTLADEHDETVSAPATDSVGLVHPAHLDPATLGAWGQILSDYEIIPPFQQLSRTICPPEAEDLQRTSLVRFKGPRIPGIVVYGMLERSHWSRDVPADGGGFTQHSKFFPAANCTAFIAYTGLAIGWYEEPQQIEQVYFVPGYVAPEMWGQHKNRLRIAEVDRVVVSEVLRLVNAIVAKAT
ncbi:MAG: DUF4132 domain-containing protein [Verrucomicrobia bacterium]|nr:DUF4132 domain-containing protein [Verrucomicrobiota bacterium]